MAGRRRSTTVAQRRGPIATALVVVGLATVLLAGCGAPPDAIEVTDETVVVDVRTPEEFDAGHLEGARNLDVSAPGFDDAVAALPSDRPLVVYCQTGNRSSRAVQRMRELGVEDVLDAGGIDAAAEATGLAVVPSG